MIRNALTVGAAVLGLAVPAVAFADHGADDGTGTTGTTTTTTTTTSTTGTTTTPASTGITAEQRRRAIAAARARVGKDAKVVHVERGTGTARYEVRLRRGATRYDVKVSRTFKVLRVRAKAVSGGGGGSGRDHAEDD